MVKLRHIQTFAILRYGLFAFPKIAKKKNQQKYQEIFIHPGHFNCLKEDTLPNYRSIRGR